MEAPKVGRSLISRLSLCFFPFENSFRFVAFFLLRLSVDFLEQPEPRWASFFFIMQMRFGSRFSRNAINGSRDSAFPTQRRGPSPFFGTQIAFYF